LWSAGGAALPTFGVPRLRRSDDVAESMSQPSRAGLILATGPTGLGPIRGLFSSSHTDSEELGINPRQSERWRRGTKPEPAPACVIPEEVEASPPLFPGPRKNTAFNLTLLNFGNFTRSRLPKRASFSPARTSQPIRGILIRSLRPPESPSASPFLRQEI